MKTEEVLCSSPCRSCGFVRRQSFYGAGRCNSQAIYRGGERRSVFCLSPLRRRGGVWLVGGAPSLRRAGKWEARRCRLYRRREGEEGSGAGRLQSDTSLLGWFCRCCCIHRLGSAQLRAARVNCLPFLPWILCTCVFSNSTNLQTGVLNFLAFLYAAYMDVFGCSG